jgi:DNA repair protein RadD
MTFDPWPHQIRGTQAVIAATMRGIRRILLQAPTGAGKSLIMQMLAKIYLEKSGKVILYSNRKMMVDQISAGLTEAGMYHGVRAAGHEDEREHAFQVSSIQTEHIRVTKRKTWDLHAADLVLVDEPHLQQGNTARELLRAHYDQNATIVGFTATPLGLAGMYDELVVAGGMSELRACGALVPAVHFGADEPDLKAFRKLQEGQDPSASQQKKAIMTPTIFGRVWEWYQKLNPQRKPCVLFGPGVDESLWFAERFQRLGVDAAHIDGNDVWLNGVWYKSDSDKRLQLRELHRTGTIQVVCNRYVLREGVDWPWIEHIILAFVAGSLQTFLQTCGRGLRGSPATGKKELIIQDHGGAWWRHGSINVDREWQLELTDEIAYGLRAERIRKKQRQQPFRCPQCGRVWSIGTTCLPVHGGCGFELGNRRQARPVVSTDGELKELSGDIFKPRRISQHPQGAKIWERMYFRSRTGKGERTFRAAAALFAYENNWSWPDPAWPFMPIEEFDWFQLVSSVPRERLR